uniref:Uncharacterized protein n=1 Tax=Anopheles dirus TaxID=7168 RepID=A0A182NW39_9DIPT
MHSAPSGVFWQPFEHSPVWCWHCARSQPSPSSAPFGQSGTSSQTDVRLTQRSVTPGQAHWPWGHRSGGVTHACSTLSSEPSPQSFSLSHFQMFGMHRPFSHANCDAAHVTLPHSNSSEWSPQSFSWSHRKFSGMQRPDLHWNSFVPHVGFVQFCSSSELSRQSSSPSQIHDFGMQRWLLQVKSQVFGHACTGGSAFGSDRQLRPSSPSRSPYGQPHFTVRPRTPPAPAVSTVSFLGSAKQSFSQPPLFTPHGCVASMLCTPWLYTFTPYRRFVCGSRTMISSCSPFSLFRRTIASSRQSVMYIHSSWITIENGCRIRREFTVRTSVPSRFECWTWSSRASHQ